MKKKINKKGFVHDLLLAIPVLLAIVIAIFVSDVISDSYFDSVGDELNRTTSDVDNRAIETTDRVIGNMDYIFIFFFVSIFLAIVLFAYAVRSHPALFFIVLFILVIFLILAAQFTNVFEEIKGDSSFKDTADDFVIITHIYTYYPIYIMVMGFVAMIVFFGKSRGGEWAG